MTVKVETFYSANPPMKSGQFGISDAKSNGEIRKTRAQLRKNNKPREIHLKIIQKQINKFCREQKLSMNDVDIKIMVTTGSGYWAFVTYQKSKRLKSKARK